MLDGDSILACGRPTLFGGAVFLCTVHRTIPTERCLPPASSFVAFELHLACTDPPDTTNRSHNEAYDAFGFRHVRG